MATPARADDLRSILIVLTGALGDIARAFAIVDPIRKRYPSVRIDWLVEERWADFVRLHPGVNNVLLWSRKRPLTSAWRVIRALRGRYDTVIDLQRILKSGIFSFASGAARRIGFHRLNSKEGNWLFSTETLPARPESVPKLSQYLDVLPMLGIEIPQSPTFGLEAAPLPNVDIPHRRSVAVVVGASWRSKEWPLRYYGTLVTGLLERGLHPVLLGAECPGISVDSRATNLLGRTSLAELAGVLRGAILGVGPDSGPGHVAAAVGTPYIALSGSTSAERTAPWGSESLVLEASLTCRPCYQRECPGLGTLCLHLLTPTIVLAAVDRALASAPSPKKPLQNPIHGFLQKHKISENR